MDDTGYFWSGSENLSMNGKFYMPGEIPFEDIAIQIQPNHGISGHFIEAHCSWLHPVALCPSLPITHMTIDRIILAVGRQDTARIGELAPHFQTLCRECHQVWSTH